VDLIVVDSRMDDGDGVEEKIGKNKIGNIKIGKIRSLLQRVWGPLPLEVTSALGAHAPVSSLVVRPVLAADLLASVKADVLHDAIPAPDESREALLRRLAQSTAFDNPRVVYSKKTKYGFFKYQSDLLLREGGQARRATFGTLSQPPFLDESGELVAPMRGYNHLYRHHEDQCMCRPMPPSLRTLGDELYTQVRTMLTFVISPFIGP
jgi:hypothetical protein